MWACAQEGIDDGARAVELVKLGGPCSHAPGAHIALHVQSRLLLQAGVDVGMLVVMVVDDSSNYGGCLHPAQQSPPKMARHGVCFSDGGGALDAALKLYPAKHAQTASIVPDAAS